MKHPTCCGCPLRSWTSSSARARPVRFREARHTAPCSCGRGRNLAWPAAKLLHLFAWKGKVFDPDNAELLNEVGPFGWKWVRAKVYKDESWLDGEQSIVLDYSGTSLVAHWVRDEIRLVAPGTYLGIVYWERTKILDFALEFRA